MISRNRYRKNKFSSFFQIVQVWITSSIQTPFSVLLKILWSNKQWNAVLIRKTITTVLQICSPMQHSCAFSVLFERWSSFHCLCFVCLCVCVRIASVQLFIRTSITVHVCQQSIWQFLGFRLYTSLKMTQTYSMSWVRTRQNDCIYTTLQEICDEFSEFIHFASVKFSRRRLFKAKNKNEQKTPWSPMEILHLLQCSLRNWNTFAHQTSPAHQIGCGNCRRTKWFELLFAKSNPECIKWVSILYDTIPM